MKHTKLGYENMESYAIVQYSKIDMSLPNKLHQKLKSIQRVK